MGQPATNMVFTSTEAKPATTELCCCPYARNPTSGTGAYNKMMHDRRAAVTKYRNEVNAIYTKYQVEATLTSPCGDANSRMKCSLSSDPYLSITTIRPVYALSFLYRFYP